MFSLEIQNPAKIIGIWYSTKEGELESRIRLSQIYSTPSWRNACNLVLLKI